MKPTEDQNNFIHYIEDQLNVRFVGLLKQEASDFIDKYKPLLPKEDGNTWAIENVY